jgi:hypothetical protein
MLGGVSIVTSLILDESVFDEFLLMLLLLLLLLMI